MRMDIEPTHAKILDEIKAMRADIEPFVEMKPDLVEMVDVLKALRVGAKGVKGIGSLATALIALGGLIIGIRALWAAFWQGAA